MVYEGTVYHPECFKDKNNAMDSSLDTSADQTMETSEGNEVVPKEEPKAMLIEGVVLIFKLKIIRINSLNLL